MTATAAHGRDFDLLQGGSELVDLGVLAARASAAARRVAAGGAFDSVDSAALAGLAQLLESSADVVRYFGSAGQQGLPPSGALAARVDVAIATVLTDTPQVTEPEQLADALMKTGEQVKRLLRDQDPALAKKLLNLFSSLASAVVRESGSPGESTARL